MSSIEYMFVYSDLFSKYFIFPCQKCSAGSSYCIHSNANSVRTAYIEESIILTRSCLLVNKCAVL